LRLQIYFNRMSCGIVAVLHWSCGGAQQLNSSTEPGSRVPGCGLGLSQISVPQGKTLLRNARSNGSIIVGQLTIIAQPSIGSASVMSDLLPSDLSLMCTGTMVTPVVDPLDSLPHPAKRSSTPPFGLEQCGSASLGAQPLRACAELTSGCSEPSELEVNGKRLLQSIYTLPWQSHGRPQYTIIHSHLVLVRIRPDHLARNTTFTPHHLLVITLCMMLSYKSFLLWYKSLTPVYPSPHSHHSLSSSHPYLKPSACSPDRPRQQCPSQRPAGRTLLHRRHPRGPTALTCGCTARCRTACTAAPGPASTRSRGRSSGENAGKGSYWRWELGETCPLGSDDGLTSGPAGLVPSAILSATS
jgi:hypothetical protein